MSSRARSHRSKTSGSKISRSKVYTAIAVVLCALGIALVAVSCAGSRQGPPMPSAAAAGTIDAGASSAGSSTSMAPVQSGEPSVDAATSSSATPSDLGGSTSPAADQSTSAISAVPVPPTSTAEVADSAPPSTAGATGHPATATASEPSTPAGPGPAAGSGVQITGPVLPPSSPVSLSIPALGVTSSLLQLGLNPDGSVQVPDLNDPDSKAGWYRNSPAPGSPGPAIILGHIDSRKYGPGVFYRLGDLRPGDTIDVARADGTVAVFRVDGVLLYPKDQFPTLAVYGNIDHAGLRLITCGGTFDPSKRSYESNIVAYATLVSSHPTG